MLKTNNIGISLSRPVKLLTALIAIYNVTDLINRIVQVLKGDLY